MPDISASLCRVRRCDLRHVRKVLMDNNLHDAQKNGKNPSPGHPGTRAIREARKAAGLTLEDVANRLGISVSQLSRIERDPGRASGAQLLALSQILGLTVSALMGQGGEVLPTQHTAARLYGRALPILSASELVSLLEGGEVLDKPEREFISPSIPVTGEAQAVEIGTDAMAPIINAGDVIIYDCKDYIEPGSIIAILAPITGRFEIGYYEPYHPSDPRAPGFELSFANPSYKPIICCREQPARILGRVVERRQRFLPRANRR